MNMIDCFTGIGGFHIAGKENGIHTICASEIDSYCCKHIDQNLSLDNVGSITDLGVPEQDISQYTEDDVVPAEITGFSSYSFEDFMEGAAPWPDLITGGFPCQNVSSANVDDTSGIQGVKSSLYTEQMRLIEEFEPKYACFENAERLNKRGLDVILAELNKLGYHAQWETISATAFGLPHYRHRVYLVAYRSDTAIARHQIDIFAYAKAVAESNLDKPFKLPLPSENPQWYLNNAVAEDTKSIKLRTKRINALGNAIIPDIASAIFKVLMLAESEPQACERIVQREASSMSIINNKCYSKTGITDEMPTRGLLINGELFNTTRCSLLNPSKQKYDGLLSTLIRKDGNNNFTTKSRLNRPGKLGGLVGDIMKVGADKGGLHPEFCEIFMSYDRNFTLLH